VKLGHRRDVPTVERAGTEISVWWLGLLRVSGI
jgi:hypothetical protein